MASPLEKQIGGDHYKKGRIQAIEFIHANGLDFCEGSAIKYIARHRRKGGKQDLEKAIHYIQMLIELEYDRPNPDTTGHLAPAKAG